MDFSQKRIGILGGMGAAASARLHVFLVEECQRRNIQNDWEFPEILHYSLSPRSMDNKGIADSEQLIRELNAGIAILEEWSADYILIACNSAFAHIDKLLMVRYERIVNIPGIVHKHFGQRNDIGVLCSGSSRKDGLYAWAKQIPEGSQVVVNEIIGRAISGGVDDQDKSRLYGIAFDLYQTGGCKTVILGCTELALAFRMRPSWIVDAAELAVKEILN